MDRQKDRQTEKTDCLTPLHMQARGNKMWVNAFVRPHIIKFSLPMTFLIYQAVSFLFDFSFACRESLGTRLDIPYSTREQCH